MRRSTLFSQQIAPSSMGRVSKKFLLTAHYSFPQLLPQSLTSEQLDNPIGSFSQCIDQKPNLAVFLICMPPTVPATDAASLSPTPRQPTMWRRGPNWRKREICLLVLEFIF